MGLVTVFFSASVLSARQKTRKSEGDRDNIIRRKEPLAVKLRPIPVIRNVGSTMSSLAENSLPVFFAN